MIPLIHKNLSRATGNRKTREIRKPEVNCHLHSNRVTYIVAIRYDHGPLLMHSNKNADRQLSQIFHPHAIKHNLCPSVNCLHLICSYNL